MWIKMGNAQPKEAVHDPVTREPVRNEDGTQVFKELEGQRVFVMNFPEEWTLMECARAVTDERGAWGWHSDSPPSWVESDSAGLRALLAEHYGATEGMPGDLEASYHTEHGPPGVGPDGPIPGTPLGDQLLQEVQS